MRGTTLHAGILAQWFEILILLHFFYRYATMVVNRILCLCNATYTIQLGRALFRD